MVRELVCKETCKDGEKDGGNPYLKPNNILTLLLIIGVFQVGLKSQQMTTTIEKTAAENTATTVDKIGLFDRLKGIEEAKGMLKRVEEYSGDDAEENLDHYDHYIPAPAEAYMMNNSEQLGLNNPVPQLAPTCQIWKDPQSTPYHTQLHQYLEELNAYYDKIKDFQAPVKDIRKNITRHDHSFCEVLKLHPDGLPGLFNKSQQLSYTKHGYVEPLMAPFRHPQFCLGGHVLQMNYLLHDFYTMCKQMKPNSRTIFIDMGASLSFHGNSDSPVIFILNLFRKFGIKFDHIYAYEIRQSKPEDVFSRLPEEYEAAYHWINLGVAPEKDSRQNPLRMLLNNYNEDDLVIIKLDVDTPVVEVPLAQQVATDPQLAKMIDHFYFEHHMNQQELARFWGRGPHIKETVAESLQMFTKMREHGIASHYWV